MQAVFFDSRLAARANPFGCLFFDSDADIASMIALPAFFVEFSVDRDS